AMVIGTTGFEPDQRRRVDEAAKEIPIVLATNMSTGVNILFKLAADAARLFGPDYDVEIVELHHNKKKDAPSGTAMTIAERIAGATGRDLAKDAVYGREGIVGERRKGEIGIHAVRGGDIVGEHTVYFAGPGERFEMTIRSGSRDTYARGAMRAARWLADRPAGLYDMRDVLGLGG
ncbi:MAG: 4-hydroxy-tetrahydrodipicolinate reductase, partial [Myxococcales bacterium]|nr:4-hydroxy-tetrahydrodipicolinate reductase [Myxococcales bacterium]